MENPLILTLALDAASQARFNALRTAHFPPERNYLQAHLTLFHALPAARRPAIEAVLEQEAARTGVLPLAVPGLLSLGKGVAFAVVSDSLKALHRRLQATWSALLTPQDKQGLRPHITVQNKVTPDAARTLKAALEETFQPFEIRGTGLLLWEYRGGPWTLLREFPFSAANRALTGSR